MNKIWGVSFAVLFVTFQAFAPVVMAAEKPGAQQTDWDAEEEIEKLLQKKFEQCIFLGRLYEQDRKLEKAVAHYETACSIKEYDLEPRRKVAELNYQLHRYDKALSAYEKILEDNSGSKTYIYTRIGNCHKKLGNIDKAVTVWKKILEEKPKEEYSYTRLGSTYSENEMYDEAAKTYKKAIELFPESHQLHISLANVYGAQNEYKLAAEECKKALAKVDPKKRRWITVQLVEYCRKAGTMDELIEENESKIGKLDKTISNSCLEMAASYERKKEYSKAIKMYERVLLLEISAKERVSITEKIKTARQSMERE